MTKITTQHMNNNGTTWEKQHKCEKSNNTMLKKWLDPAKKNNNSNITPIGEEQQHQREKNNNTMWKK